MSSGEDCYFYYYSTCTKGAACQFRHCAAALGREETCPGWAQGKCTNASCDKRHMNIQKNRNTIPCFWESQPSGCQKQHCPFMHTKHRGGVTGAAQQQQQQQQPAAKAAVAAQPRPSARAVVAPNMQTNNVFSLTKPRPGASVPAQQRQQPQQTVTRAAVVARPRAISRTNTSAGTANGGPVRQVKPLMATPPPPVQQVVTRGTVMAQPRSNTRMNAQPKSRNGVQQSLLGPVPGVRLQVNTVQPQFQAAQQAQFRQTKPPHAGLIRPMQQTVTVVAQPRASTRMNTRSNSRSDEDLAVANYQRDARQQMRNAQPQQPQSLSLAALRERRTRAAVTSNSRTAAADAMRINSRPANSAQQAEVQPSRKRPAADSTTSESSAKRPKLRQEAPSTGVGSIKVKTLAEIRAEKERGSASPDRALASSTSSSTDVSSSTAPGVTAAARLQRPNPPRPTSVRSSEPRATTASVGSTNGTPSSTKANTPAKVQAEVRRRQLSTSAPSQPARSPSQKPTLPSPNAKKQAESSATQAKNITNDVTMETSKKQAESSATQAKNTTNNVTMETSKKQAESSATQAKNTTNDVTMETPMTDRTSDQLADSVVAADHKQTTSDDDDIDITEMDDEAFKNYMKERFGYDPSTETLGGDDLDDTLGNHDDLLLDAESMM